MASPFPGMDPYLEQDDVWHDFHERFVAQLADLVGLRVRPVYIVKIDEHVFVHEVDGERWLVGRADVAVATARDVRSTTPVAVSRAPAYCQLLPCPDVERVSYVEVRDRQTRRLVTVIELLSPSNKRSGPDREQYQAKRRELLASDVHVIEIDLLRGGMRSPLVDLPDCDYCVTVSRVSERPQVGVWPIRLREPLPKIPVPLRTPDPDASLDLQQALGRVYDAAGYADYIYEGKPQPPLHPTDAAWAAELLAAKNA